MEIKAIKRKQEEMLTALSEIKSIVRPEEELWDNEDMIRHYHLSARTLAGWRAKGIIEYIKIENKIYYPRSAREKLEMKYGKHGN